MDSGDAVAILCPFKWTDVGTWESVREFNADDDENHLEQNVIAIDTSGTLIKTQSNGKLIAVAGLKDMVIVDSDDALLIIPRDDIDKIKEIQARLAETERHHYL